MKRQAYKLKVKTYCVNAGTSSQYFGLKTVAENQVLHSAPNNWKTERGALNWAKKKGYEVSSVVKPKNTTTQKLAKPTLKPKPKATAKKASAKPAPKKSTAKTKSTAKKTTAKTKKTACKRK